MGQLLLEPDTFGDVAETPHPADRKPGDALGLRVAFDRPPVPELDQVVAVGLRLRVQLADLGQEGLGILDLGQHVVQGLVIVSGGEDRLGEIPHLDELPVEAADPPVPIDDQDPVGGGVEGRIEQRQRVVDLGLGPLPVGDVLDRARHDHRGT